jgi:hypothetical protein
MTSVSKIHKKVINVHISQQIYSNVHPEDERQYPQENLDFGSACSPTE